MFNVPYDILGIRCLFVLMLLVNHYMPDINKDKNLTSATKNRATTFEDWIGADCIHVFLTAMRSAK